ncbi:3-hydroxyacyl-ACP dehydratase FabZ [Sulfitobacter sp. 1A13353]|jgi:3-hydroxyacyl-[acyl-carrier-protein] dehydratase|uniref:3-hydroxyacyl-ACP dehydratase FabZ n=1 Tax=Sulfitobacter sp. 1A13353 TaxID=3368568 RepID=UPI00374564E0
MQEMPTHADLALIKETIPHRSPFLMIDEVINIDSYKSGVGIKNVSKDDPILAGHFPEDPVFPGVLIIEAMGQTAGLVAGLGMRALGAGGPAGRVALMTIDKVRLKHPVYGGDRLELHMQTLRGGPGARIWTFQGEARVGDRIVCLAEFNGMHDTSQGRPPEA